MAGGLCPSALGDVPAGRYDKDPLKMFDFTYEKTYQGTMRCASSLPVFISMPTSTEMPMLVWMWPRPRQWARRCACPCTPREET